MTNRYGKAENGSKTGITEHAWAQAPALRTSVRRGGVEGRDSEPRGVTWAGLDADLGGQRVPDGGNCRLCENEGHQDSAGGAVPRPRAQDVQEFKWSCRLAGHNTESHQRKRRRLEGKFQGNAKRHEEGAQEWRYSVGEAIVGRLQFCLLSDLVRRCGDHVLLRYASGAWRSLAPSALIDAWVW